MAFPHDYLRGYDPKQTWGTLKAVTLFMLSYSQTSDAYVKHPALHYVLVWQGYCAAHRLERQVPTYEGFDHWYADDGNRSRLFDHVYALKWEDMPEAGWWRALENGNEGFLWR